MDPPAPVLDLTAARPQVSADEAPVPEIDLRLMAGELALVDARHAARPAWVADLCCGLVPLAGGRARFLGRDWSAVPPNYADALRGRIGRVFFSGSWIGFMDVATNILLPQLHHTRDDPSELRERATTLCCAFGLPGLPLVRPGELAAVDSKVKVSVVCPAFFQTGLMESARAPAAIVIISLTDLYQILKSSSFPETSV